jgi:predicted enzyme related to lactoylglutathione lyase
MKHNIVWFDVPVVDLDRAIRFYSAVLNAEVKKEDAGGMSLAMLPTPEGGQMGCLCVVEGFKPSADGIMIYFGVNGRLKEAVAAVRANGGTVQSDVHSIGPYGFRAEVLDSEGNCIALHSETED